MTLPASPAQWQYPWRELYEERAAIVEYDAGKSRAVAEQMAERMVRRMAATAAR